MAFSSQPEANGYRSRLKSLVTLPHQGEPF